MLEKLDMTRTLDKKEFKSQMELIAPRLAFLQRECRSLGIPVIVVFEGFGAAGKGTLISQLIAPLDPRGFQVYAIDGQSKEEKLRPFLWRFWTKTPEKGRIAIFDRSWYRRVLIDRFDGETTKEELANAYDEIVSFERQLADGGNVILKFFLSITKEEQKKRFQKLEKSKSSAWKVSKGDWKRNKHFEEYQRMNEEMLQKTDTEFAPWNIVEAMDKEFATVKILSTVVECLTERIEAEKALLEKKAKASESGDAAKVAETDKLPLKETISGGALSQVDLSKSYTKEEYKKRLKELQKRIKHLHGELYRRRIPVVLAFEGWDAGGKGGAIKRLTEQLDPRGYEVHPTAAPNDIEKAHHYLWRFWQSIPKAGHIAIFDRTWYGRVMVERIEGFCSTEEWQRAYREMNEMEQHLANFGAVVIKFWLHIDKDEQARRFQARTEDPAKQWKITDEDWRNREKWDAYEEAVNEMLLRTSTTYAPWVIVEANSKYYARIKVLETVVEALEKRLSS